jgi:deoxyadenosine/deoxycytidine kinase
MTLRYKYITIEGNIGAGKTSLATMLAKQFDAQLVLEQFADNPFLPLFYETPQRYAFPLELFFMAERFQQLKESISNAQLFQPIVIADYLFIKSLLFARINLNEEEYKLYQRLFHYIYTSLPEPELLVYLHCEVPQLLKNIEKRGRPYEKNISADYLQNIQDTYFNYFKTQTQMRILVIDTTHIDFVNDDVAYNKLIQLISAEYDRGMHYIENIFA